MPLLDLNLSRMSYICISLTVKYSSGKGLLLGDLLVEDQTLQSLANESMDILQPLQGRRVQVERVDNFTYHLAMSSLWPT